MKVSRFVPPPDEHFMKRVRIYLLDMMEATRERKKEKGSCDAGHSPV